MENKLIVFKDKEIRRTLHKDEWWFSVIDVVGELTDSANSSDYIKKMRKRDAELSKGWGQIATPLQIETSGGKQKVNCANTEGIFRIIQSIPSPKYEPFKRWLAKVGYERVQEIEDPEYAILTAEISKAAFGVTPAEYKNLKGLKRENLRDHMTDLELIFSMLGEVATTEIARKQDAQGFDENKTAAKKGGKISGDARENLEIETGDKVVSSENYLIEPESRKRLKRQND